MAKQYFSVDVRTNPDTGEFEYRVWAESQEEAAALLNSILNGIPPIIDEELVKALIVGPSVHSTLRMLQTAANKKLPDVLERLAKGKA